VNGEVHGGRPRPTGAVVPRKKKSIRRLDSSVDTAVGYRLNDRGLSPVKGNRFFSTPQLPDRLWDPPIQWVRRHALRG
jgi:hypothetical protein